PTPPRTARSVPAGSVRNWLICTDVKLSVIFSFGCDPLADVPDVVNDEQITLARVYSIYLDSPPSDPCRVTASVALSVFLPCSDWIMNCVVESSCFFVRCRSPGVTLPEETRLP